MEGTACGVWLARLTSGPMRVSVQKWLFRLSDIRDESGTLVRLRVLYFDVSEVQDAIVHHPTFQSVLGDGRYKNRLPIFLRKQVGIFWRTLLMILMAAWKSSGEKDGLPDRVLFINRELWRNEIERYALKHGVTVKLVTHYSDKYRGLIQFYFLSKIRALRNRWLSLKSRRRSEGIPNGSPKLSVDYYGHLNLNHPQMHSDLFFWQQSQLSGCDIQLFFHVPQDPLDSKKWEELRDHGMTPVVLNPAASAISKGVVFHERRGRDAANGVSRKWPSLFCRRRPELKWLERQMCYYQETRRYWTDVFEQCHTKIYVSWYKYDATHCAIADALQSLGGVTAMYQRVYEEFPAPENTVASDVMFAFSRKTADVEKRAHSSIPYLVVTGYIGDHRFAPQRLAAQEIRNRLRQHGARRILALFDENSSDSPWQMGHEFIRENYVFLIEKILREPWLGLVIKPKAPSTLRKRLGPVADLLEKAEQTGRCIVLDGAVSFRSPYPPALAAMASDIAIHGHLYAATAGMESALAGVPTLLMDREGWPASMFHRRGRGNIVFTAWEDLWEACQEHWQASASKGRPALGDWAGLIEELDPYRDGRAAERMGNYLHWMLEGFKAGHSRERVLADAAERYCEMWGKDKVLEIRGQPGSYVLDPAPAANS